MRHARPLAPDRGCAGHEEWVIVQIALRDRSVILRRSLTGESIAQVSRGQRWLRRRASASSQMFLDGVLRVPA
ncbi:MAG: hypothetical protein IPH26_22960 [Sterolibacteriaceae bacterium]|uniref:Uncharacterized protein n=1 Tax=Candidatus Methylophosphatis roskildensis TaxID=2899263 RepID=A0A9D7E382_9PROT|nr:hypothetical protein [Candidatus Methylophosphatis roskildensis]